jgi:hypothetical protein
MRFLLLLAYDESGWAETTADKQQEFFDAHHAFEQAVYARGRIISGDALAETKEAFTLRHTAKGWQRTEGPFAETVEQIGGFYLLELPDEQAALDVAQQLPRQYTVEVRPTVDIAGYEPSDAPSEQ